MTDDLINRTETIAIIDRYRDSTAEITDSDTVFAHLKHEVEMLPSAEPQRKRGKWNISECYGITIAECSECKRMMPTPINKYGATPFRYCPYCGSDNKGDDR